MRWLNDEVFVQQGGAEKAEVDEEQDAFENDLGKEIEGASKVFRRRREQAVEDIRREAQADEDS